MATPITEERPLRFEIEPRPSETARACIAIARAAVGTDWRSFLMYIALYIALAVVAYIVTPATWLATYLIGLGAVFATSLALHGDGRWRLKRLQAADPHATETYFVELSAEGVRTGCAHVDARYRWEDYAKVLENDEFLLFVRPNGTGAVLPKRVLDDATEAVLRARIGEWAPEHSAGLASGRAG